MGGWRYSGAPARQGSEGHTDVSQRQQLTRSSRMLRPGVLLALVAITACEPFVDVTGTVRDAAGAPIAGAVVTLHVGVGADPRAVLTRTDSAGHFVMTRWGDFDLPIRVRACRAGYAVEQREFPAVAAIPESLELILRQRADDLAASGGAPAC
jgi:hypothetical protein